MRFSVMGLSILLAAASMATAAPRTILLEAPRTLSRAFVPGSSTEPLVDASVARPVALAAADFDEDGTADLACAFADALEPFVAIYRGDVRAIFPTSSVPVPPFESTPRVFAWPVAPDFLEAGDFDADGHADLVAAKLGVDTLYFRRGDGKGGFAPVLSRSVRGGITALGVGEIHRADGLPDLIVGIDASDGAGLLVLHGRSGVLGAEPEFVALETAPQAIVSARLDDDIAFDVAAAAGDRLVVLHGRVSLDRTAGLRRTERVFPGPIADIDAGYLGVGVTGSHDLAVLLGHGALYMLASPGDSLGEAVGSVAVGAAGSRPRLLRTRLVGGHEELLVLQRGTSALSAISTSPLTAAASEIALPSPALAGLPMRLNRDALTDLVLITEDADTPVIVTTATAEVFTVTNTDNSGNGSLREAIKDANSNNGADRIEFAIPGTGVKIITLTSDLDNVDDSVTIDGYTQTGATPNTLPTADGSNALLQIVLDGTLLLLDSGIDLEAGSSTVRGLVIRDYSGDDGILIRSSGNIIEGNYLGTDFTGMHEAGNSNGARIENVTGNTIGGTTPQARNLLSGNDSDGVDIDGLTATGNTVLGNYIGPLVSGNAEAGNDSDGIEIVDASNNVMGGTAAGSANVISGNDDDGIFITGLTATGNLVLGNVIGQIAGGGGPLPNDNDGILLDGAPDNTIGGTTSAARNLIGGNSGSGILLAQLEATGNVVSGNYIGINATGMNPVGNAVAGIEFQGAAGNLIGGTAAGAGNVISGNTGAGIVFTSIGSTNNTVEGNLIGLAPDGTTAIGNQTDGIRFTDSSGNTIGGATAEARNVISGNGRRGIAVFFPNSTDNTIQGNFIGTDVNGTADVGNQEEGILIFNASNTIVGGSSAGEGNVISGNEHSGVSINQATALNNVVRGNTIGADVSGTAPLGNTVDGVRIELASGTSIGGPAAADGNLIAWNGEDGIGISGSVASKNRIAGNSIHDNTLLGIDLGPIGVTPNDAGDVDSGPNGLQNFPVLLSAFLDSSETRIQGTLQGPADSPFTLEFFANDSCDASAFGEADHPLHTEPITTGSGGSVVFELVIPNGVPRRPFITATATDALGNTSELSYCITLFCSVTTAFPETVFADPTRLLWTTAANIRYAKGDLASVGSYSPSEAGSLIGVSSLDISPVPPVGTGYYFVVRHDACGSWQTQLGAEPARDVSLP